MSTSIIDAGPIEINIEILGELIDTYINAGPVYVYVTPSGSYVSGIFITVDPIVITIVPTSLYFTLSTDRCNWIKWSKIGSLDFTIDESNVAGERPLDWKGCIVEVLKLGKGIVVYGTNGVTMMTPAKIGYTEPSVNWSMQTIYRLGVVCKPVGTEFEHYFIDITNKLQRVTGEGIQLLDYSEYLRLLTNPRMSLDPESGIIYICDGTYGFVYSTKFQSFGVGPVNVTGVGAQSGLLYAVAPEPIEVPKFNICTDIYDLGTRKPKTIQWIEVGTDLTVALQAMVETRISNKGNFIQSKWILVNPNGIAYIPCYGVEFKFHLRSYIYEYIELDYIKVTGVIHGFGMLDQVQ